MSKQDKPTSTDPDSNDPATDEAQEWVDAETSADDDGADDEATAVRPRSKAERRASRKPTPVDDAADDGADAEKVGNRRPGRVEPKPGEREISVTLNTRTLFRVLAGIVAIALVAGVVLLGWGYHQRGVKLEAFDDVKATSRDFSTKLVSTMNTENAGKMKELLGPMSTGEFREHLAQQQSDGQKAVEKLNVKATSEIKSVSVERFDTDTARTSVLMEVKGTSSLAPDGGTEMMLIWLDLRHEDGQWRISKLDGAQAGIGGAQGERAAVSPPPQNGAPQNQTPQNQPAPAPAG